MNLARHAAVLWRFRLVTGAGLALGIVLAVLASYQVPSFEPRGAETWSSESSLLVTQPGFPEGRVILPSKPIGATEEDFKPNEIEFADPGRFTVLADLYAQLAVSDQVLSRVPEKPSPGQIQAMTVQSSSGAITLPVIKLSTMAESGPGAQQLNNHIVAALRDLLESEQARANVPDRQRVQLQQLNAPTPPFMVSGPSKTASVLAFILCLIGVVAVTHLLEALRNRRRAQAGIEEFGEFSVPWAVPDAGDDRPRAVAASRSGR
jgi:capsular polysaccharide biosynthesis protein